MPVSVGVFSGLFPLCFHGARTGEHRLKHGTVSQRALGGFESTWEVTLLQSSQLWLSVLSLFADLIKGSCLSALRLIVLLLAVTPIPDCLI